uniref:60-kDa chaperonin n=1 Tax=Pseudellipsoidion edaphicum TaxID=1431838 RepID=A0A3R5WXH3_9STRA|nr:60-kDa chaperonin [Pseudellipsoidion edaphicum]QAA11990.1 60-kDa chaperonin [Pseudellipsoidion edaphicum]
MKSINHQHIINSNEVQTYLERGIKTLAILIEETYGPLGKNILFDEKKSLSPELLKNGSKITCKLRTRNQFENLIFLLLEDSFQKVNNLSADGAKTFFLISSFIILKGFKNIVQNSERVEILAGIKKTIHYSLKLLHDKSQPINSKNFWNQILDSYLPNEQAVSNLFKQAYDKVGKSGQIIITDEPGDSNTLTIQRGLQIQRGYFSPYFVTDTKKMIANFDKPYLLITSQKISLDDGILIIILEQLIYEKRPFLLISPDIEESTLSTLILNKVNGILDVAYIKIPEDFNYHKVLLEDLAIYTKAKLIKSDRDWRNLKYSDLGQAQKVILTKTKTMIWAETNLQEKIIEKKCQELKQQILLGNSDYENEKKEERRKNFKGTNATVNLVGITDLETSDLKIRCNRGLLGAKSCLYEGVLPGGGTSFVQINEEIENWSRTNLYGNSLSGSKIVVTALLAPIGLLLKSQTKTTSLNSKNFKIIDQIRKHENFYISYDIKDNNLKDMYTSGIIDSFKSIKIILQTSKSLVSSILSIANLII